MALRKKKQPEKKVKKSDKKLADQADQAELNQKEYVKYIDRVKLRAKNDMGIVITNIDWYVPK